MDRILGKAKRLAGKAIGNRRLARSGIWQHGVAKAKSSANDLAHKASGVFRDVTHRGGK
jgi:uncharacterized protein YjbJ (UPF0337 family)